MCIGAPKFVPIYEKNTVFVPLTKPPYLAQLKCGVTADPPATINWYRYGKKIKPREYDVSFEEKDNEKILKVNPKFCLLNFTVYVSRIITL